MRAGSLCTGIGGLDLAVEAHFGAELAWYAEVEPAPCTVLEREWPGVPNLRDLTAVDWSSVDPVDVLSAGYPCQPFSHAGKRKGADDDRHLWPHVAEAVRVLRPRWVVLENVAGHLTLGFGDVLRDLAEAGFDAEWCVLRASDVGAPHQRARVFIVATDATGEPGAGLHERSGPRDVATGPGAGGAGCEAAEGAALEHGRSDGSPTDTHQAGPQGPQPAGRRDVPAGSRVAPANAEGDPRRLGDGDGGAPADTDGERLPRRPQHDRQPEAGRLTQRAARDDADGLGLPAVAWGQYQPAIWRWGLTLGRPAPRPTDDAGRLSPAFVEWMMGYPQGWVDGLTRTQALKALGNAVVPQQGYAALAELASLEERAA